MEVSVLAVRRQHASKPDKKVICMAEAPAGSPLLVYATKSYSQMLATLGRRSQVAIDTESDSLYSYYPKVCLIQISVKADPSSADPLEMADYLVDPLRLDDLAQLGQILASQQVEVVMHAAENDMLLLYRNFGFTFGRIFDTQLAARILGWKQVGLAAILENQFGITSDKRMQRTDWGKRPLTPQQIAYAQMDTHYLLALRDRLVSELQARGRYEEAMDAFDHLTRNDYSRRRAEERTFWNMKSLREVPAERLGLMEVLWQWREQEARHQDRPPFKVVSDAVLIDLANRAPADRSGLRQIAGLSDLQIDRYGGILLGAVRDGIHRPRPAAPHADGELRPEALLEKPALARFDALRKWRSEVARERDVAPDIVLTNATLLTIAQQNPHSEAELLAVSDLTAWKARTYGPGILATLHPLR